VGSLKNKKYAAIIATAVISEAKRIFFMMFFTQSNDAVEKNFVVRVTETYN